VTADPDTASSLVKSIMTSAADRQSNTIDLLEACIRVAGWGLGQSPCRFDLYETFIAEVGRQMDQVATSKAEGPAHERLH
jgi:hypothetical protein